jgi:SAM-dependent methyltransferase
MRSEQDVFGRALMDWVLGGTTPEIAERDDGYLEAGAGYELYLSSFADWSRAERQSIRHVRGRVLDVGCGAGRAIVELQRRGCEVVGLDASPLAVRAARLNGAEKVWRGSVRDISGRIGAFDTVILFGNNFGLFGTPKQARRILTSWARATKPNARILAESISAYSGGAPLIDRSYYWRNRERGSAPGQLRMRYRYGDLVGPWFSWLFVSRQEMRHIVRGTGWHLTSVVGSRSSESYVAILEKD